MQRLWVLLPLLLLMTPLLLGVNYLEQGGTYIAPAESGTVNSANSGNAAYYGATGTAVSGSSALVLSSTKVRSAAFDNASSGTVTLQTVTGALGTPTISLPAETGTVCTTGSVCSGYAAQSAVALLYQLAAGGL